MLKLATILVLPALGIVVAALAQLALTTLWPGIQRVPSGALSIDSCIVVLLTFGLCFFAGRWANSNVPTAAGAALSTVVPLIWLGLVLRGIVTAPGKVVWFGLLTMLMVFTAVVPLITVGSGWVLSSSKHRWRWGV
jgi:hypothetical protein